MSNLGIFYIHPFHYSASAARKSIKLFKYNNIIVYEKNICGHVIKDGYKYGRRQL